MLLEFILLYLLIGLFFTILFRFFSEEKQPVSILIFTVIGYPMFFLFLCLMLLGVIYVHIRDKKI